MSIEDKNTFSGDGGTGSGDLQARATEDLGAVTSKAKEDLDAIKERAAGDVRKLGQQATDKVSEVTDKAKSFASDQKSLAADQINGVASAITKVADELDGSDQGTVARYARDIASGLSNMGKQIENRDIDDLMGMAQDFGRKQPVAFLGAAALAGFVASRFALASAHRRDNKPTTGANTTGNGQSYSTSGASYSPTGAGQAYGTSSASRDDSQSDYGTPGQSSPNTGGF